MILFNPSLLIIHCKGNKDRPQQLNMAGAMFEEKATRISIAVRNNNVEELKSSLKNDEDVHHTDRKGNTYLHYACTMHRPCIFHILVTAGINVNAQNRHGNTALHVTALQNDCSHVGDLLAAGIDPTIKNKMGKTAAEIETKNKFWKTIYDKYQPGIFQAVEHHDVEQVLYLLHCWTRVDCKRGNQTLRQFAASRKFHDLVFHIDKPQHTMGGIYAILEGEMEKAAQFLQHSKCNVNLLNYASETSHILQHALKNKDLCQVRMICQAKANLNIQVTLECYLKAPLFFGAFHPELSAEIMWTILRHGPDFTLRDERGRNAAIYALDKTNRKIPLEVIAFMMSNGLDVSQRDETGVTLTDVARFARRKDILELIDKAYVKVIRSSDMNELKRLCINGYDGMLINFKHRDTFIYASGNETEDVLDFIQKLPEIRTQIKQFHHGIRQWSRDRIIHFLRSSKWSNILINAKDKGGRTALHLAILHWRMDLLKLFLSWDNIEANAVTNVGRTAYHYACCVEEETEREEFCRILSDAKQDSTLPDYRGFLPDDLIGKSNWTEWIQQERKMCYGMKKQIECVDKYEELSHMMKYRGKNLRHFEKSVCRFRYPVAEFHKILSPLMPEYRDLIFIAMDRKKEDIATRLIQLGTDWTLTDWVNADVDSTAQESKDVLQESETNKSQENTQAIKKDVFVNRDICITEEANKENSRDTQVHLSGNLVECQAGANSVSHKGNTESLEQNDSYGTKTNLQQVTVEELASRLGMLKVLAAIEKKKQHHTKKQDEKDGSKTNDTMKEDGKTGPCKDYILSPIRHMHGSENSNIILSGVCRDDHANSDIQFTLETLEYESDTNDEPDNKNGNESTIEESSENKSDDEYSDDEFYSDDNSISDYDE